MYLLFAEDPGGLCYKGTLLKGNMFSLNLIEKSKEKNLEPFVEMGRVYGNKHCFEKEEVIRGEYCLLKLDKLMMR